jgi:hypothetical protein
MNYLYFLGMAMAVAPALFAKRIFNRFGTGAKMLFVVFAVWVTGVVLMFTHLH